MAVRMGDSVRHSFDSVRLANRRLSGELFSGVTHNRELEFVEPELELELDPDGKVAVAEFFEVRSAAIAERASPRVRRKMTLLCWL